MNNIPTIKQELDRKTLETLIRLEKELTNNIIDLKEYNLIRRSIFDVVSGLVDREIIELLSFTE